MRRKRLSKIVVGVFLVLVLALALPLTSACAPEPTTPTPTPGPTPTPTPGPAPTPTPGPAPTSPITPGWEPTGVLTIGNCSTASTGFASGTAMVETFSEKTGVNIVVIPNAATADRAQALKNRLIDISWILPTDILFALDGRYEFETMGPQSWRVFWVGGQLSHGFPTRADAGIEKFEDLIGKNIPYFVGYQTIINDIEAALAFGNLTYDDVVQVPVSGYAGGLRGVLDGTTDVTMASVSSGLCYELEASIHGIHWIPMPRADTEAWARFKAINPTYFPVLTTWGAGNTPEAPTEGWAFNYLVGGYDDVDPNLTYWFAKQIHETFDLWKDKHVYLHTWTLEEALNTDHWIFPLHEGTIQYYKDIGVWTPEMEAKQQGFLAKWPQTMTR